MKLGVREICEVVFRAKAKQKLGNRTFYKNEPVLYFDTLKTSSLEGAATTVYATGGRGNSQLIAWEGERTLTFNMEDALISPESFSILSGAGLMEATAEKPIYVHMTSQVEAIGDGWVEIPNVACWNGGRGEGHIEMTGEANYHAEADIYCMKLNADHEIDVEPTVPAKIVVADGKTQINVCDKVHKGDIVLVDYYVKRVGNAMQIEITPDQFGGYYYVEASTLFRREADGKDLPAEFVIPKAKVQSNFTFSMAATGDPSTFNFVMDAFPDYTKFDGTKKVLAAMQVIMDTEDEDEGERANCTPAAGDLPKRVTVTSEAAGVTVKSNGTNSFTVTGNITSTQVLDDTTFGDVDGEKLVEMAVTLPTSGAGTYTIKQTNPALEQYSGDPSISNATGAWVKTKTYNLTEEEANKPYQFLLSDKPGNVVIELYKAGVLVGSITIVNSLTFDGFAA